uniref:Methyltransferase-like protein 9 n=1 Tax=Ascaris lumbricoides TaxID=6252 RepID=A0A0M3IPS4_ASCLU
MYRGHRIAQMLLAKEESDNRLLLTDKSEWYLINHSKLSPLMSEKWHQFFLDREAENFLEESFKTSNSICLQMLDLGAGDGRVTSVLAQFYKNVAVTEASKVMEWRLAQRGFRVLPLDKWTNISGPLHLVSVLNLLDRHFDPVALLGDLYRLTSRTNALLLIAVVLPIRQYVEFHPTRKTTNADSKINVTGETLEEQASSLVEQVFIPSGFELIRWGKLPYLCEGDQNRVSFKIVVYLFLKKTSSVESLNKKIK